MSQRILPVLVMLAVAITCTAQVLYYGKHQPIEGKHYRFPEFREGTILMKSGQSIQTTLDYNLITQEIVIDLGHTKTPYPSLEEVTSISIDGIEFIPMDGVIYELLLDGDIQLLVHRRQKVSRDGQAIQGYGQSASTSSSSLPPSLHDKALIYGLSLPGDYQLEDVKNYFLRREGELISLTKLKKLERTFPSIKDDLKTFIKKEKTKLESEEDLIKLIEFCNNRLEIE